jgi:alpha-D-ribose 1-methylphosphonate 5-triphosphate diphosphatase
MGSDDDGGFETGEMRDMADALAIASRENRLKAEHLIHLRCEVSSADVVEHFETFEHDPQVRLVSMMDHAPGQRQFQTMDQYTLYYKTKRGMSDEAFAIFVDRRKELSELYAKKHRDIIASFCNTHGITVASHDDATIEHVAEAIGYGVRLAEFPTSHEAARASHQAGMSVLMGAPNIVRGKSHSGNISAKDLADQGILDVLSSDYVPLSLICAPFVLADAGLPLEKAIAMVTSTPARTVNLTDRGRIAPDLRADLVRIDRRKEGIPVVRSVWREGQRVI